MTAVLTQTNHIRVDENGVAHLDGTRFKVIDIALDRIAYGWSAEEIVCQHWKSLSLAQVHAALACYYDHQAYFDAQIHRDEEEAEQARLASLGSLVHQKLLRARQQQS